MDPGKPGNFQQTGHPTGIVIGSRQVSIHIIMCPHDHTRSLNRPKTDEGDDELKELGDSIPDEPEKSPFELLKKQEVRDLLAAQIDSLPEKERMVLSLYYFNELTMKEVGKILGVTESRVSQLHSAAILRMRGLLEGLL